ncbi:MFS transporter [Enterococcus lactis]|uniref:MFS transporter n=1 Tax=Enterococcus lactis TaxID=357441 RepID=UPI0039A42999
MNQKTKPALLSVSLLVVSAGAIAGNIPAIESSYPLINKTIIELLTTLPSLFIILTVLLSPKIARVIGYKKTIQLGVLLVLAAGLIPVFTTAFATLFFSRILFGIGIGLFNPLLYSFASNLYSGRELASVIGLQSAFEGIGGMLITFLVGQLLVINWRISFGAYLLALPVFFLFSRFVPEIHPNKEPQKVQLKTSKASPRFLVFLLLLLVTVTVYMSVTVKITSLLITKGIGNATDGSNLIALVGLGAMVAGMLFGRIFLVFKQQSLVIAFGLLAIAMFLFAFSQTLVMAIIAALLCGFGFRTFIPYLFNEINQQSDESERNTAILLIVFNLGAAFSPISIAIFQGILPILNDAGLFIGEGLLMLLIATIIGITNKKRKTSVYNTNDKMEEIK